jgi:twitching motility protein PilT
MITLDAHLQSLYTRDIISADEAVENAQDSNEMRDKLLAMGATLKEL